jgi:hypothetical protein
VIVFRSRHEPKVPNLLHGQVFLHVRKHLHARIVSDRDCVSLVPSAVGVTEQYISTVLGQVQRFVDEAIRPSLLDAIDHVPTQRYLPTHEPPHLFQGGSARVMPPQYLV